MSILRGIGQFWWDFVIGDDWKIAAAVVSVLAAGAVVVALEIGVAGEWLAPILAAGVAAAFTVSLVVDVRAHRR